MNLLLLRREFRVRLAFETGIQASPVDSVPAINAEA
jgi:hypothetical protein